MSAILSPAFAQVEMRRRAADLEPRATAAETAAFRALLRRTERTQAAVEAMDDLDRGTSLAQLAELIDRLARLANRVAETLPTLAAPVALHLAQARDLVSTDFNAAMDELTDALVSAEDASEALSYGGAD